MNIERTYEELNENLICEHKTIDYGETFFHSHNGYELFLLLNGDVNFYIGGEGARLVRGSLVCIKPNDYHRKEMNKKGTLDRIVINIKKHLMESMSTNETNLAEIFDRVPAGKMNILHLSEQDLIQYTHYAHQLINVMVSNDYGDDILAETYIKQILILVNRLSISSKKEVDVNNIMPQLVTDTINYIEKHLTEEITLEKISNHLHHNGTYISRCFKNITGISLQQYIIGKRLNLAKNYLCEGYTPYDSCCLSGFNNYSNFSRTFTKQIGISPKKYQKSKN